MEPDYKCIYQWNNDNRMVLGWNLLKVSDDLLNMLRHLICGHVIGLFIVPVLDVMV